MTTGSMRNGGDIGASNRQLRGFKATILSQRYAASCTVQPSNVIYIATGEKKRRMQTLKLLRFFHMQNVHFIDDRELLTASTQQLNIK
jgi:hypothetical protein